MNDRKEQNKPGLPALKQLLPPGRQVVIAKTEFQKVFDAMREAGYSVIGPTIDQAAVVYQEIESVSELPIGWKDEQSPGHYRLQKRFDGSYFGYGLGPQSWKKFLYPPKISLFKTSRSGDDLDFEIGGAEPRYAFIGVRACELAAIERQDRIFLEDLFQEPSYRARRRQAFILAVNCVEPGATCFCHSMGIGPGCDNGYDLALTELEDSFLVTIGSDAGADMLDDCDWRSAGAFDIDIARRLMEESVQSMDRKMDVSDMPGLLYDNLDHPRWQETAERCLSCMNCTLVCPTCFCVDIQDISDLTGDHTERVRMWDSCFNPDFSHVYGGNQRPSVRARYRQWLTHKLASWIDQFGSSGCVGCGRCITWCPVGIDLTEEVAAIRGGQQ